MAFKALTPEGCKEIAAIQTVKVVFAQLGTFVLVRKPTLDEIKKVHEAVGSDSANDAANQEANTLLCSIVIVDEKGNQPFNSAEGLESLRALSPSMRLKIVNGALGMIGLDGVAIKNS